MRWVGLVSILGIVTGAEAAVAKPVYLECTTGTYAKPEWIAKDPTLATKHYRITVDTDQHLAVLYVRKSVDWSQVEKIRGDIRAGDIYFRGGYTLNRETLEFSWHYKDPPKPGRCIVVDRSKNKI